MKFTKMQSYSNDYIIINNIDNNLSSLKENRKKIIMLNDRNLGIGANGIIFIEQSKIADFKITIYNKDGTIAKTSGNGLLCVARYLIEKGLIKKDKITIETYSTINEIIINKEKNDIKNIIVNMKKPSLEPKSVPVLSEKNIFINENINIFNRNYKISCITVGNPFAIIFERYIDSLNLGQISKSIQYNQLFPEKVNVVFAQILNNKKIKIRIWEKGNDETKACGSAACATVVAYTMLNNLKKEKEIVIEQKGGNVEVLLKNNDDILLKGNSQMIYKGKILVK